MRAVRCEGGSVWRCEARLSASPLQWAFALCGLLLSFGLLSRFLEEEASGDSGRVRGFALAASVVYVMEICYLVFLRVQSSSLQVDDTSVAAGSLRLLRARTQLSCKRWLRLGRSGRALVLQDGDTRLCVVAPGGLGPGLPERAGTVMFADALVNEHDFDLLHAQLDPTRAAQLASWPYREAKPAGVLAVMGPWLLTMLALAGFGLAEAFVWPELMRDAGRLFVSSVVLGVIGLGLVFTFSKGGPPVNSHGTPSRTDSHRHPVAAVLTDAPRRPSFGRAFARTGSAWLGFWLLGLVAITPFFLAQDALERWIDIPGCTADCEARGGAYYRYFPRKSGSVCMCSMSGRITEHLASYTLGGEPGTFAETLTAFLRAAMLVGGLLATVVPIFLWELWSKLRKKRQRPRKSD